MSISHEKFEHTETSMAVNHPLELGGGEQTLGEYVQSEAQGILRRLNSTEVKHLASIKASCSEEIDYYVNLLTAIADREPSQRSSDAHTEKARTKAEGIYFDSVEQARTLFDSLCLLSKSPTSTKGHWSTDSSLNEAYLVYELYRPSPNSLSPSEAEGKNALPSHDWQTRPSNDQAESWVTHLRQLDVHKEAKRITIDGLELLNFSLEEQELRDLLSEMPAVALEEIDSIKFIESIPSTGDQDGLAEQDESRFVTTAHHRHFFNTNSAHIEFDSSVLNVRRSAVIKRFDNASDIHIQAVDRAMQCDVRRALAHEIGHALHTTLPVAILGQWERAIVTEVDVNVSDYVLSKRESGDVRGLAVERFAETFGMLYDRMPVRREVAALASEAPAHFEAMLQILRQTGALDFSDRSVN